MSWVDLGAVALMLWGAAKGYLSGVSHMFLHVLGLCIALICAVFLQKPFTVYLNQEWQAEAVFVGLFTRNVEQLQKAGTTPIQEYRLPALAGTVMRRLSNEPDALAVVGQDATPAIIGQMLVSFTALTVFFIFLVAVIMLVLRIWYYRIRHLFLPEWQRQLGMFVGVVHGLTLSLTLCVFMDAISMFSATAFLEQDLSASYLFDAVALILRYI